MRLVGEEVPVAPGLHFFLPFTNHRAASKQFANSMVINESTDVFDIAFCFIKNHLRKLH